MYLYNKNVLEYAQIARSEPKSMIPNIKEFFILWKNKFRNTESSNVTYIFK